MSTEVDPSGHQPSEFTKTIDPANPWVVPLEKAGISFEIPRKYLWHEGSIGQKDARTGLIQETDASRTELAEKFSKYVAGGGKWAIIRLDGDHVKGGNSIAHQFGNAVIAQGVSAAARALNSTPLHPEARAFFIRQEAADEATIIVFDPTDEELSELQNNLEKALGPQPVSIPNPNDPQQMIQFSFSSTMFAITSDDKRIQEDISKAANYYTATGLPAFELFNKVFEMADEEVKNIKIIKDLSRFSFTPAELLASTLSIETFKKAIIDILGDTRMSGKLLQLVLNAQELIINLAELRQGGGDISFDPEEVNRITHLSEFVEFLSKAIANANSKRSTTAIT